MQRRRMGRLHGRAADHCRKHDRRPIEGARELRVRGNARFARLRHQRRSVGTGKPHVIGRHRHPGLAGKAAADALPRFAETDQCNGLAHGRLPEDFGRAMLARRQQAGNKFKRR